LLKLGFLAMGLNRGILDGELSPYIPGWPSAFGGLQ
jgi:hypothetical protein